MERRRFLEASLLAAPMPASAQAPPAPREAQGGGTGSTSYQVQTTVERRQTGKPHQGKVLAAIQPHCDDIPIFAGGTVLKLIDEGYTGYLITVTDDSMAGTGATYGEIVLKNEQDTNEVAKRLGCKDSIFLNYPNHNMDAMPVIEMRARFVFLFRALKVDTVMVYDPSALYERNPDHYVTARAVEWAAAIAGTRWDYPEHFLAGLKPHAVRERYYFARGPQLVNRVVDTSAFMDGKVFANMANVTQGPSGNTGARLRQRLAQQKKKLPLLGNDDETANREYTRHFALARDRVRGQAHSLEYAEYFHYIGPDESDVDAYVERNAVPL
ncbi:MAG TPA: PIG-L family deacetylase [Bryobacteraceae bacterium]|nr:PIG-L family deacetylase [Bryobacteraceae bacterium]